MKAPPRIEWRQVVNVRKNIRRMVSRRRDSFAYGKGIIASILREWFIPISFVRGFYCWIHLLVSVVSQGVALCQTRLRQRKKEARKKGSTPQTIVWADNLRWVVDSSMTDWRTEDLRGSDWRAILERAKNKTPPFCEPRDSEESPQWGEMEYWPRRVFVVYEQRKSRHCRTNARHC